MPSPGFLRLFALVVLFLSSLVRADAQSVLRFAVIGDSGTGEKGQYEVARAMEASQAQLGWKLVLMLGDNIYENGAPEHFRPKFKEPYAKLLQRGVEFHASLGNHDRRTAKGVYQIDDPAFGYVGRKDEYDFEAGPEVEGKKLARFLCLNSEAWIRAVKGKRDEAPLSERRGAFEKRLASSDDYHWNFLFMHHPLYSYVRHFLFFKLGHGSATRLREEIGDDIRGKIDVVFAGHDHFYQKIRPQAGVHHFVSGAAGKLRSGVKKNHRDVEFAVKERHFLLVELSEDELKYQAIGTDGKPLHEGRIERARTTR